LVGGTRARVGDLPGGEVGGVGTWLASLPHSGPGAPSRDVPGAVVRDEAARHPCTTREGRCRRVHRPVTEAMRWRHRSGGEPPQDRPEQWPQAVVVDRVANTTWPVMSMEPSRCREPACDGSRTRGHDMHDRSDKGERHGLPLIEVIRRFAGTTMPAANCSVDRLPASSRGILSVIRRTTRSRQGLGGFVTVAFLRHRGATGHLRFLRYR